MERRVMALTDEDRWLAVGQSLEGLMTRVRAWLMANPPEMSLDDMIRRRNDHLLDDIGVRRACLDDQVSAASERHRFWML